MNRLFLSTAHMDPDFRNEFWRTLIRPIYEISSFDGDTKAPLEGKILSFSTGPLTIGATAHNQQRYQRDKRLIGFGGLDFYMIQMLTGGSLVGDFDGRDVRASLGDIVIIDLARTVKSEATAGRRLTTTLPRQALQKAVGWQNLHGVVLRNETASTQLITQFLRATLKIAPQLTADEGAAAQQALIHLFAAAIRGQPQAFASPEASGHNVSLKEMIIAYIDQQSLSPKLTVTAVQDRFNISRAHLYRLFEAESGISSFIKDKRLSAVLRAIARGDFRYLSTKQVAYQAGFETPEAFSRQFRARYGVSPKEMLKSGMASTHGIAGEFDLHGHLRSQVMAAAGAINKVHAERQARDI
jgi:AraC-like DNA-binding protein